MNKKKHENKPANKSAGLIDSPSTLASLAWAIANIGIYSAPRSSRLQKFQSALQELITYSTNNLLTVNTLKKFYLDPTNNAPSADLYKDFQTIGTTLSEGDSAWKTAFSTYAVTITSRLMDEKFDSVNYILQSMSQQLSFLSQEDQPTVRECIQLVKTLIENSNNPSALNSVMPKFLSTVDTIRDRCGMSLDDLLYEQKAA